MFDFDDGQTAEADHGFDVDADERAAPDVDEDADFAADASDVDIDIND